MTSSPPIRTSPTRITVGSGLNVLLASLYGDEIRSTSWTPSSISINPASGVPCPTAPSTVRVTPVDRCTSMPISTRRFTTSSICSSVARSCITTTILFSSCQLSALQLCRLQTSDFRLRFSVAVNHAALETPRFVDDAFEQPGDRVRPQRTLGRDPPHVRQHLLLALGLIHLHAELFLDAPDLARNAGALVEQPDEHLVDAVDVVAQIVKRGHRSSATARIPRRAESTRCSRSPGRSRTRARCRRPPRPRTRRLPPRAPAARCRSPARSASAC